MFIAGGRVFHTLDEAKAYADFIARVSRLIISIERF
jgi:hypothetical protein